MMNLVWLRADLRTIDNPALSMACADAHARQQGVMAVYCISAGQWQQHDYGNARIDFELRTLAVLSRQLQDLNIPLKIITADFFAEIPSALGAFCQEYGITQVYANRQYEWNEIERDRACHRRLKQDGINIAWSHDQCIVMPDSLKTNEGNPYTVFTPFKRKWLSLLSMSPPQVIPAPVIQCANLHVADTIPTTVAHYSATPALHAAWQVGEAVALDRLAEFCQHDIYRYQQQRDIPSIAGTSQLAAHLAVGSISAKQCWQAAQNCLTPVLNHPDIEQWISELAWRDFYRHIMQAFPRVSRGQPFKLATRQLVWDNDPVAFQAWCAGQTGYPIVDAAMRCLNATGWMHNRLRMIVSMFLVKDLLIDWRWGERYFMQQLIDADVASNNGGWQWSASTGNDAVPYFRIFNPVLQSKKFDPKGTFIRTWLPELRDVPQAQIHAPYAAKTGMRIANYPAPIIDHATARVRTLAAFAALR